MNKDVIYIEPEDDITDILANIKGAKNKIVALVPPKKAGVLQSSINFKLIAKTARQYEKTVVLISSDESLLALASRVKMPTASSLQSKPHLPNDADAKEFGDDGEDDDATDEPEPEDDEPIRGTKDDIADDEPKKPISVKVSKNDDAKKASIAAAPRRSKDIDIELGADDIEDDDSEDKKSAKTTKKDKNKKVPNFKKYRKFIILAVILIAAGTGFFFWATQIAPRAKITVQVKTTASNFNQTVTFVTDETKSDPEKGIFYAEQKTTKKSVSADFEATGEVDKGTKASGTITVTRPKGDTVDCDEETSTFSIPANTTVTIGGKQFIVTEGGSANAGDSQIAVSGRGSNQVCSLAESISSGKIAVVAKEAGDSYNIGAASSGITLNLSTSKKYSVTSSAMSGGVSKIAKIVSQEDVEKANADLSGDSDKDAREELTSQFSSDYIMISSSFAVKSSNFSTSPSINQEVGDGVTPKIIRETEYVIYAVKKSEIDTYIRTIAESKLGDDTQMLYSTGVALDDGDEDKAFFESYKNEGGNMTAKLKSTTKSGPRITEDKVKEVSMGVKVGKAKSNLNSYNGVSDVKIETSFFWVTSIPDDDNKVEIEITVE